MGIDAPPQADAIASVVMAICDGLMLQWLADSEAAPDARQAIDALTLLAPFLTQ
jgi:hypothetical protein